MSYVDFIRSHIFEECPGGCVLTRNFPKMSKAPPHTTLLSQMVPKILLFCTIRNEVSYECLT